MPATTRRGTRPTLRDWHPPIYGTNTFTTHSERREGDEMACSCGKRWPVGEDHP